MPLGRKDLTTDVPGGAPPRILPFGPAASLRAPFCAWSKSSHEFGAVGAGAAADKAQPEAAIEERLD
jgi:hypothetical protein